MISSLRNSQFVRFVAVGCVNTVVGYGVFLLLAVGFGVHPSLSNAIGYAVALAFAYVLYRAVVFDGAGSEPRRGLRFIIGVAIAFALNQLVLLLLIRAAIRVEIAQILAMTVYALSLYILNKHFVFRPTTYPE